MSSGNSSMLNEDRPMIVYGLVYLLISAPLLPLYSVVMTALYMKDQKTRNMTYKLMNVVNFFEIGQAVVHFLSCPLLVFPILQSRLEVFVRILGCLLNTFWIAELPVMALLAVCRIMLFREVIKTDRMALGVRIALILIFSWISFVLLCGCVSQNFMLSPPSWEYDMRVPYAGMFADLELLLSFSSLIVAYLSYLVISFLIYNKRKVAVSIRNRDNEISILIQYTFTITYIAVVIILWHRGGDWFDMNDPNVLAAINSSWIACSYMSPVMLLILNRSIRKECQLLLGVKEKKKVSSIRRVTTT